MIRLLRLSNPLLLRRIVFLVPLLLAALSVRAAEDQIELTGTLATPGAYESYSFNVDAESLWYFDHLTSDNGLRWTLTGPAGTVVSNRSLTSNESSYSPFLRLWPGNHVLTIDGSGDNIGDYALRIARAGSAQLLTVDTPVNGSLDPGNLTVLYQFPGTAGDALLFDYVSKTGLLNLRWRLVDPLGGTLLSDSFNSDEGPVTLTISGTHYLLVEGYINDTDAGDYSYNLVFQGNTPPTPYNGTPMTPGTVVNGNIAEVEGSAQYTFTVAEAGYYAFDSLTDNRWTWTLVNRRGTVISNQRFDFSDSVSISDPTFRLYPGEHQLTVQAYTGESGDFSFNLLPLAGGTLMTPGTLVEASLSPARSTRVYRLNVSAGDRYYFDYISQSGFGGTPQIRLIDPYDQEIIDTTFSDQDTFQLNRPGTYTLLFEGRINDSAATGEYSFNFRPVTPEEQALSLGTVVEASIDSPGATRTHVFTLAEDTILYFDSFLDASQPRWRLSNERQTLLSNQRFDFSDSGNISNPLIHAAAGEYRLEVDGSGDFTGNYRFRLLDLEQAAPFTPGTVVNGSLATARGTMAYSFNATAGERFFFDHISNTGFSRTPHLRIYDPDSGEVFGQSLGDRDAFTFQKTGRHLLLVEGFVNSSDAPASFSFNLQPVTDTTQAIALDTPVTSSIDHFGQRRFFTFTLGSAEEVYFDSLTDRSDMRWSLAGPAGTVVNDYRIDTSDEAYLFNLMQLPAGDYTLTVDATGSGTGSFSFELLSAGAGTVISPDSVVNGSLSPSRSSHIYRFNATTGDRYYFDVQQTTFSPQAWMRLVDPLRNVVFSQNLQDENARTLDRTGEYLLLVEGRINDDTASDQFAFEIVTVNDETFSPTIGSITEGTIGTIGERHFYPFTLVTERMLVMDSQTDRSDLVWSLSGPTGLLMNGRRFDTSDSYHNSDPVLKLKAGDYLLTVDGSGEATGDYRFRLLDLADATPVTPGNTVNGTMIPARGMEMYRFAANAGDRFDFDGISYSSFALSPYWYLIDPFGRPIFQNFFADETNRALNFTGTYTLILAGRISDNASTGSYSFLAQFLNNVPPPMPTGTALSFGTIYSGNLPTGTDESVYTFSLFAEKTLYFDNLANNTDVEWTLTGPRGTEVSNRRFNQGDVRLELIPGDYAITVTGDAAEPGDYSFRVLDADAADLITPGTVVSGTMDSGTAMEVFRFNASAGDRIYVDYRSRSGFVYTPNWAIVDPYRNVVFSGNFSSDQGIRELAFDGEYLLTLVNEVYETGSGGSYEFNLVPVTDQSVAINLNETINGSIDHAGQIDRFTFSLAGTTRIYFDSLSNLNQTEWSLSGPEGTVFGFRDFDDGELLLDLKAGDYTLTVDSNGDIAEPYAFRLMDTSQAPVITPGIPVNDTLTPILQVRLYQFEGTAGERFFADYLSRSGFVYTPNWLLVDPDRGTMWSANFSSDAGTFTLQKNGTHLVILRSETYETSSEGALEFNLVPVTDESTSIALNQTITGNIGHPGQEDRYPLSVATAARVLFDSRSNNTETEWWMTGPDGTVVGRRDFDDEEPVFDLAPGDYTIHVDGNGDTTESYGFRLVDTETVPSLTPGQLVSGSLDPVFVTGIYQFNATAGSRVYADFISSAGFVYSSHWRLLDPERGTLFSEAFNSSDPGIRTLPYDGTYLVILRSQFYETANQGTYEFSIVPIDEDSPTPILEPATDADLIVENIQSSPSTGLQSGDSFTLSWQLRNAGSAATSASWQDLVTVRKDGQVVLSQTLFYDASQPGNGPIDPNGTRSRQLNLTLPDGPNGAGTLQVTITTDAQNTVLEQNAGGTAESNNASFINLNSTLAPYPDLQVSGLTVNPPGAWSPGTEVTVQWQLDNTGDRATAGDWLDALVVRNVPASAILDSQQIAFVEASDGGPIPAGGSRARQSTFIVPNNGNAYGLFEITVTANSDEMLFEHDPETNANANNQAMTQVTSAADLQVTNVAVTGTPQSGANLTFEWEVLNTGNSEAGSFYDRVQLRNLTTDETVLDRSVHYNSGAQGNGVIEPGTSRMRSTTYRLPDGPRGAGTFELIIATDRFNNIREYDGLNPAENNNSTTNQFSSPLIQYPDLIVRNIEVVPASPETGQEIAIRWEDYNQGTGPAGQSWNDRLTIVNTSTGLTLRNTLLQYNVGNSGPVAAGAAAQREHLFRIPDGEEGAGNLQITIQADANNQLFELHSSQSAEQNNSGNLQVASTLADYPDLLAIAPAFTPSLLTSGSEITLSWKTTNSGAATVSEPFLERIQVRNLTEGNTITGQTLEYDPADEGNGPIAPGESRDREWTVILPDGPAGTGEIEWTLTTDYTDRLFEYNDLGGGETNNVTILSGNSSQASYPDLLALNVTAPATANPGETIEVSWDVRNDGDAPATGSWTDRIFLSTDNQPGSDSLLGTLNFNGTISAGQTVSLTQSVTLPTFANGDRWLVVKANSSAVFYETDTANNTAVAAQATTLPNYLDFSLSRSSVSETAGTSAARGYLSRNTDTSSPLTVQLSSDLPGLVVLPETVTIPANNTSVSFNIEVVNDMTVNGTRTANLTATATDFNTANRSLAVTDDDRPVLTLQLSSGQMNEAEGPGAALGYLTRNAAIDQPLTVSLGSSYPLNASVPETAAFEAGNSVVVFELTAPNNDSLDGTRTVSIQAGAEGYNPVSQSIQVTDNDLPALSLTPQAASVVEGAESPATTGVLSRNPAANRPVEVLMIANPQAPILLPPRMTIPSGDASAQFNINVLDDDFVNGSRTIQLIARVIADDGRILNEGAVTNTIDVFDNDGPTLTMTTEFEVVNEGGTLNATVSRNTETSQPLTVQLSRNDPSEISVPASVEIPAGQSSAPFVITGVEDSENDGVQPAFVEAMATGFNAGTIKVNVADTDLPDLAVSHIVVPATGQTDARAEVTWRVTNNGKVPADGSWTDRVYISRDNQLGGDLLAVSVPATGPLNVGEFYVRNQQITLPSQPGTYHIIVITDVNDTLLEGSERNNQISVATINVSPNYRATIATDIDAAPSGTTIPMAGRAFYVEDDSPALYKLVTIRLRVNGTRRVAQVLSDENGNFTYDFQPLPTEAGRYEVGADHPLVNEDVTQDEFRLLGMRSTPKQLRMRLIPDEPKSTELEIRNASDLPLSGLSAQVLNGPDGIDFQLSIPGDLPGNGTVPLDLTATTTITNQAHYNMTVRVTSSEGAVTDIPTTIDISPLRPLLVSNPPFLQRGMLRGAQSVVSFEVSNVGGSDSGPLEVLIPDEPWIDLASTSSIPSLAPGDTSTVTLTLNPAEDLPLLRYDGILALAGGRYGLHVPFQFRAISDSEGDLRVRVTDEYTYFVEGGPQVTNATVRLRDPISGADVAEAVTDETGEVLLTGIMEGSYTLEAFADRHTVYRGTVRIVPGIESEAEAFISRQTVTYRWSVVPIEIEDQYRIVLESVFETEVPIPNVIIEEPYIMPLVVDGEKTQFEIKLRNEGLIAAENVQVVVPNDPRYIITPLVDEIGTIPAKSAMSIPVTIELRNPGATLTLASYQPGANPVLNNGDTCDVGIHDCLPKVPLGVTYTYVCGNNNVKQARKMDLTPICVGKSIWDCIKSLLGADEAAKSKGNLAKAACEIIDAILTCAGANLTNCEKAAIQIACRTIVGAATGGAAGAAAGAGSGAADSLGCLCDLLKDFIPSIQASGGGGGGGIGGGGTVNWGAYAGGFGGSSASGSDCSGSGGGIPQLMGYERLMGETTAGVCARVRIRIEQQAVMTRAAFLGTLEIENDGGDPLSGVEVTLDFRDEQGNPAEDMFVWREPLLNGISDVSGNGVINGGTSASVRYTFIPTRDAAATQPTVYRIGGTLRYIENGVEVVVPMLSSTITVYPEARLQLKYFQSRNVYSDDPFTDEVEPAEPFALGLIAQNIGAGAAKNFRITSAQPEIIENEKGLLIDFKIIGTTVGEEEFAPTLTANLGTIEPGASEVAQWIFLSSLQGKFIEYSATFEHLDSLGSTNLSLIDSVEIHELIHPVQANRAGDDNKPDFLVNDVPDPDDFPDTLYFSDGTIDIVEPGSNGMADGNASLSDLTVEVTATMPAGWGYMIMDDPGPNLELYRVVDGNGREMLVGKNVWTTDRTFPSALAGAVREHKLHLLDHNGTGTYTLYYRPNESVPPTIVGLTGPTGLQNTAVDSIDIEFSEPILLDSLDLSDVSLSLNDGPNLIVDPLTLTDLGNNTYRIGGLNALTGTDGNYRFTLDATGIEDLAGNMGSESTSLTWSKGASAPVIVSLGPVTPDPRNVAVDFVDVVFSRDINATTIDLSNLSMTRNGGENLIGNEVSLTQEEPTRFRIGGLSQLTLVGGDYTLTVDATNVEDTLGTPGTGQLGESWTMITSGPEFAGIEELATDPRNIVVLSLDVYFTGPIDPGSFTHQDIVLTRNGGPNLITGEVKVEQVDATTYRVSNFNWVVGQEGNYDFTVNGSGIQDLAGNTGSGSVTETWTMITTRPAPPSALALVPDLGVSNTDRRINTLSPQLTGNVGAPDLTLRVVDETTSTDLGAFPLTATSFMEPLQFEDIGVHRLKVYTVDAAANVSESVFLDLFIDIAPPTAAAAAIEPNPRNTPVDSLLVTFSEAMNEGSFETGDLNLTVNDGANLINGGVSWTKVETNRFRIDGLTALTDSPGNYLLSVDLTGLEDLAGNTGETALTVTWQRSGANTAPVLSAIPNMTGNVGVLMLYTNTATDADLPANQLTYSLDPGAPANAAIDANTGLFGWRPTRAQAPGSYPITVRVTDNGVPALSDTQTFTVSVGDYSEMVVGTTIVETGDTGTLPLTLLSSAGVTNISMRLTLTADRLSNHSLTGLLPQVADASVDVMNATQLMVNFSIDEGLTIVGSNRLGLLQFEALTNRPSAFIPVEVGQLTAPKADGNPAPNILTSDGKIIVVDRQPLLEAVRNGGSPQIVLYGRAGDAFIVEMTDQLGGTWSELDRVPMLGHSHPLAPIEVNGEGQQYYRARVYAPNPPVLDLLGATNGMLRLFSYGEPGAEYLLETNSTAGPAGWTPVFNGPLTNSFRMLELNPTNEPGLFFRFQRNE